MSATKVGDNVKQVGDNHIIIVYIPNSRFIVRVLISGPLRRPEDLGGVRVPDVPYDPDRGEDHRDAEDLSHEGLGRAAEEHDAQGDADKGGDPHDGAEAKRGWSPMAQLAVFQPSRQLDRDRGQRADGPREDRRDSEEEDEGRNAAFAAGHTEEPGHNPEGEAEDEGEEDGGQIGRAKSPPMASPSRRSASNPDEEPKASRERPAALLPFQRVRWCRRGTWEIQVGPSGVLDQEVRSTLTERIRPRSTEIKLRYPRGFFFVRNRTWTSGPSDSTFSTVIPSGSR